MRPRSRAGWVVLAVFGAGVLLRIALVIAYRPAFLGIPDAGTYVYAAHWGLLSDPVHPAGYAAFLRALHLLPGGLITVTVLQHALGVLTALLLFLVARRARGELWVGLVPAAVVLFNGLGLWSEHTPLSDPLFTFLVAAILLAAVGARDAAVTRLLLLGVLIAAASLVRTVGLLLIPVVLGWLLLIPPRAGIRGRLAGSAVILASALIPVAAYVAVQEHRSGVLGLTEADGRITYAVAAPFARCSEFTPPPGTRALCQDTLPARRQSVNAYLWGYPDHGHGLAPGGRGAVSPAWRVFGPMPGGNDRLASFGRQAILHQPLDYLSQVLSNFSYYWRATPAAFLAAASRPDPFVQQAVAAYYSDRGTSRSGFGVLSWYGRHIELDGALIVILLIASLSPLVARRSAGRRVGVLCAGAGWALLVGSALVTTDPRYALPALGPLALAGAVGLAGLSERYPLTTLRYRFAGAVGTARRGASR